MVSIVIPIHNRLDLFKETVESLQAQTCPDFEALVVDDHSEEDVRGFVLALKDERFKYFASERRGANPARNLGLANAMGEYITFLDSDDLYHPKRLEHQLAAFAQHSEVDGVACYIAVFRTKPGDSGKVLYTLEDNRFLYRSVALTFTLHTMTTLWRASFLKSQPGWNEDAKAYQDVEYHINLLLQNPQIHVQNEVLAYFRLPSGGQNITRMPIERYHETLFAMLERLNPVLKPRGDADAELRSAHLNAWCLCYRMLLHDGNRRCYQTAMGRIMELAPPDVRRRLKTGCTCYGPIMVGQGRVFRTLYGLGRKMKKRLPGERSVALRVTWIGKWFRRLSLETEAPSLVPFLKMDAVPGLTIPE
jgi:glycosyltransferase involved in cell wall biosynthesis